jgi:hypothetical protein
VGDKFPLSSLPGWEPGRYFGQQDAFVEIRAYHDENGDLIAPWQYHEKFTAGTLVSITVSLVTYVIADMSRVVRDRFSLFLLLAFEWRQVYQVQVEKIRILDRGDGAPAQPRQPPAASAYSSPSKRARDDSGDADFDALPRYSESRFVPAKKARAGRSRG